MDGGWCTSALQSVLQPLDGWWLVHTCVSKCVEPLDEWWLVHTCISKCARAT